MFCEKCGKQLIDGEQLCSECGASVVDENAAEQIAEETVETVEEPVVETVTTEAVTEEPVTTDSAPAVSQPAASEPVRKSKKKFGWIAAVIAVVLAAATTVGAFWEPIKGKMIDLLGSDEAYFAYVQEKNTNLIAEEFSNAYGSYLDGMKMSAATEMSLTLNVGDKATSMIEALINEAEGTEVDLDWLNSVCLNMDINVVEEMLRLGAGLELNDRELLNAEAILDLDKGKFYAAILSLSDEYLKGELDLDEFSAAMKEFPVEGIKEALPSKNTVATLLSEYITVVYEQLDEVEKSKELLEVGDIEQKVSALEVEIDDETAKEIATAVLEKAKSDKTLKRVIVDFAEYVKEYEGGDDADEIYNDFIDGINDALEELESLEAEDDKTLVKIVFYVDGSHNIIGGRISENGEELLSSATIWDGNNFAYEAKTSGVDITGTGTEKKDVISGEFVVNGVDMKLCDITLTEFTTKDNLVNGNIRITPSTDLLKLMGLDSVGASAVSLVNFELELGFDSKADGGTVDINLLSGGEMFVGFTVSAEETNGGGIKIPTGNVVDVENIDKWLASLDVNKLIDNLKKAGVPSDLLNFISG